MRNLPYYNRNNKNPLFLSGTMNKIIVISVSIIVVIVLLLWYVQPIFVSKLMRSECFDGGVSHFVDKRYEKESWLTLEPVAIGKIQRCKSDSYYLKKDTEYEEVSRWTFYNEISRQNKACSGCLVQTRFESLS